MHVDINLSLINEAGLAKIGETVPVKPFTDPRGPLMTVRLPSGSVLLALPISSINPSAPPRLEIRGRPKHEADNQLTERKIVNRLRPACRSKHLPAAVKMIKAAINQISKPRP